MTAGLVACAHLPLVRMAADSVACGPFSLWRMPFEVFDALSLGAFSDHRAAYVATAPVFLRLDWSEEAGDGLVQRIRTTANRAQECKFPSHDWGLLPGLGLAFMVRLHADVIDRFSAALALAAPHALLPRSRWSVTFVEIDPEHSIVLPGADPVGRLRIQGDADLEYLFAAGCAGSELDRDTLVRAAEWQELVDVVAGQPDLAGALRALCDAGEPSLSPDDQSLLCSVALEALLLPEVRSGLAATFATRAARLPGACDAAAVQQAAAALYDARSASLHGAAQAPDARAVIHDASAAQLLAAAIVGLAHAARAGLGPAAAREALDAGGPSATGVPSWTLRPEPAGLRRPERISPPVEHHPLVFRVNPQGVQGVDRAHMCHAPLVGLGLTSMLALADPPCPVLMPLSGQELMSLEDKDIARDFLGELLPVPEHVATLCVAIGEAECAGEQEARSRLRRLRNLAGCALRCAGLDGFIDPELAGLHVRHGKGRPAREPSVFRQTVLIRARKPPERWFTEDDRARTGPMWTLMQRYDRSAGHADVERWLGLLLRLHQRTFLSATTRAGLGFALVEGLLGRFRAPAPAAGQGVARDVPSLEELVAHLTGAGGAAARWFATEGRSFRNALAHGRVQVAEDGQEPQYLAEIGRAALPRALRAWLDHGDPASRPSRLLLRALTGD